MHGRMPVVRFKNLDKVVIIVHPDGGSDFGKRHIRRDDEVARLVDALFVDVTLGRLMGVFLEHIVKLFLREEKLFAKPLNRQRLF